MFDSMKTPRTIAPAVRARLIRQGLLDKACFARSAPDDACALVRLSLPVLTARDSVDVFVSVETAPRLSATFVHRLARDGGSWRIVRRAASPAWTVRHRPLAP
jgi:hypothetical protein